MHCIHFSQRVCQQCVNYLQVNHNGFKVKYEMSRILININHSRFQQDINIDVYGKNTEFITTPTISLLRLLLT